MLPGWLKSTAMSSAGYDTGQVVELLQPVAKEHQQTLWRSRQAQVC